MIKGRIYDYISTNARLAAMSGDVDIFATGGVSSLFAVQIVMWIQQEFGVAVLPDELDIENFRTPDLIVGFVERKLSMAGESSVRGGVR